MDGAVDDLECHGGNEDLGFGDLLERELGILGVDCDCSVEDRETGRVDLDARFGDTLDHYTVLIQKLTEGLLAGVVEAGDEELESFLGLWGRRG